jgi:hypothetical protein
MDHGLLKDHNKLHVAETCWLCNAKFNKINFQVFFVIKDNITFKWIVNTQL